MSTPRTTLLLVLAAGIGGTAVWLLRRDRTTDVTPAPNVPPPPPPATGVPAAPVATPPTEPAVPPATGMLLLPDGSLVAPLNGVTNPPKLLWQNPEWSPIVRKEHNGGLEWYVHGDGTYSTTQWIWRAELGRYDATSFSLHPRAPVPVAPLPETEAPPGQNPARR